MNIYTSNEMHCVKCGMCAVFRPGVEYSYRYESEALTGIKTVSDQVSGLKIRCTVKVQIHRDGSTLLKVC